MLVLDDIVVLLRLAAPPLTVCVPSDTPLSEKATVPVGAVVPVYPIVAVNVVTLPAIGGFGETVSPVDVVVSAAAAVVTVGDVLVK